MFVNFKYFELVIVVSNGSCKFKLVVLELKLTELTAVILPPLECSLFLEEVKSEQDFVPGFLYFLLPLGVVTYVIVHFSKLSESDGIPDIISSLLVQGMLLVPSVEL